MSEQQWRPDIQGLRAVAVGLVVAAHAGIPGVAGGFIGVDVFFVISGFLITTLLLREADRSGRVGLAGFYARRARRILPAATLVAVTVLAYVALVLPRDRLDDIADDALWSTFFAANVHFAREQVDYFASEAPSPFQHYWSLSVEEQFYLVWPLLVLLLALWVHRRRARSLRRTVACAAGIVFMGSLGWSLVVTAGSPVEAYFSAPARSYELAAGALVACVPWQPRAWLRWVAGFAGALGLAYATVRFDDATPFPGHHALLPVAATALLLLAGPRTATGRLLSLAPARYVGDISYSLYLWHWPVLILLPTLVPQPSLRRTFLALAVTLALSAASHRLVELPFQQKRVPVLSHGQRSLVLWPTAVALILGSVGAANSYASHLEHKQKREAEAWFAKHGGQTDPLRKHRVRDELRAALRVADDNAPIPPELDAGAIKREPWQKGYRDCYVSHGESKPATCRMGDPNARATVALVGDSHAGMWMRSLDTLGKEKGFRVVPFVKTSCAAYPVDQPSDSLDQPECDDFRSATLTGLRELEPDSIVATSRGQFSMKERGGRSVDEQWSKAVRTAAREYTRITPDVRVLGDVPSRDPQPADCISARKPTQKDCVVEPTGREARSNEVTERAVARTRARYTDLTELVCADGRCPLVVGDLVTYHDGSHLSASWTEHVTPAFGRRLGDVPRG